MAPSSGQFYKVKLITGRILGPLDQHRVRALIKKNQIVGTELAREYPEGDWKDINLIPALASLLVDRMSLASPSAQAHDEGLPEGNLAPTKVLGAPADDRLPGATKLLESAVLKPIPELDSSGYHSKNKTRETETKIEENTQLDAGYGLSDRRIDPKGRDAIDAAGALTTRLEPGVPGGRPEEDTAEKTLVPPPPPEPTTAKVLEPVLPPGWTEPDSDEEHRLEEAKLKELQLDYAKRRIAHEPTVVFENRRNIPREVGVRIKHLTPGQWGVIKKFAVAVAVASIVWDLVNPAPAPRSEMPKPFRPQLPVFHEARADPEKSQKLYQSSLKFYVADNVLGYRAAAEKLLESTNADVSNVKALALLASSYLNLIDSSNKDENYFMVISKLIEMSRAKGVDLPETVIADVEFYITINKPEAAENRIVEYTRNHQTYGAEMFYYLALAYYHRADFQSAAKYIANLPEDKLLGHKVLYLKGLIAEKLSDPEAALKAYERAVQLNPDHVKSRLRIAELLHDKDQLANAGGQLQYIVDHNYLMAPGELARAYYLHALLNEGYKNLDVAVGDAERAVKLDPGNHDYLLELYGLRGKLGDSLVKIRGEARMYFFLGEGEKQLREGQYQDALTQFLKARDANDRSPVPLIKIGDMFERQNDLANARLNYKLATDRAPNSIQIWSKYIDVLIRSFEWAEAQKAMDRFSKLPVNQSAIDKAAGDMYERQGRHADAQQYYKKAMARDSIDPAVYIAYAKSLMATKNFKDAPFFFALALRFDPLNTEALIGTAKCVAATESIDRAINILQDELQKGTSAKAELLAGIAELQIQKGAWDQAQRNVEQAMAASQEYAYPWKLQAQIHRNKENTDKRALDRALEAYQSYSDRNPSDPSGYLERYRIFVQKQQFEKADDELTKIFAIYPKYPNVHYYKGALYSLMGNHKVAIEEFRSELNNNPQSTFTMIALGKELLEGEKLDDALSWFNKAMQVAPRSGEAKHYAGYSNYLLKNLGAAIALYRAALLYDNGNPLIHKRLGMALRDNGDEPGAAQEFREYLRMEPDAPDRAQFSRYQ